ncbi:MAG TPA: alpha/beta hydrolase [Euryarchaeota archaeon]|nr:alpha/beta hydrolase [Euryarchaeota archaeon]
MKYYNKYVITSDGLRIRYVRMGTKNSPSIIFIHGLGERLETWKYQISYFSSFYNVVALDLRGFGLSETPSTLSSVYDYVEDVRAVISEENIERVIICGLSLGGLVAIASYDSFPDIVSGLVLADSTAYYPRSIVEKILPERLKLIESQGLSKLSEIIASSALINASKEDVELVKASIRSVNVEYYKRALEVTLKADLRHVLPKINVPTLILVGEYDKTTPLNLAKDLKANIKTSDLKVVKNASHISKLDNPEEFNSYLKECLERITQESTKF